MIRRLFNGFGFDRSATQRPHHQTPSQQTEHPHANDEHNRDQRKHANCRVKIKWRKNLRSMMGKGPCRPLPRTVPDTMEIGKDLEESGEESCVGIFDAPRQMGGVEGHSCLEILAETSRRCTRRIPAFVNLSTETSRVRLKSGPLVGKKHQKNNVVEDCRS